MQPWSSTTITSAFWIVESRCDANRRAPLHQLIERGLHDAFGFGVELVGGFVENQIGAFRNKARAMEIRWRWPPETVAPFSPTVVA